MAIDVEIRLVAMHPLADPVRQPAYGEDVTGTIKNKRIGLVQAFASQYFVFDREQALVVGLEWVRVRHLFNNNPAFAWDHTGL